MDPGTYNVLLLVGRPASGKSEIIDFLKRLPEDVRRQRYHLAALDVLDDFPMLWTWFEEDDLLSRRLGRPRLYTDERGYFKDEALWHLLIERLGLEYRKRRRDDPAYPSRATALIEFARGVEHGGYAAAFAHLDEDLLRQAAIVYVRVSFEESLRKNRRRANPDRPDSILEHSLPDDKLEHLYRDDDWTSLASGERGVIKLGAVPVPFAVFENSDDVTTGRPDELGSRLQTVLAGLWELYRAR